MIIGYYGVYRSVELSPLRRIVNKKFVVTFILSTLILIISNVNGCFALQYTNYTSNKSQIQFQYPSNWLIKEKANRFEEGSDIDISKNNIAAGKIRIHFINDLLETFGSTNLDSVFTHFYEGHTTDDSKYEYQTLESPSFVNIDGQRTGSFLMTFKQKNEIDPIIGALQYWITFVGNNGYVIDFISTSENYGNPDNIEIRDHFIKSINFLGLNNITDTPVGASLMLVHLQN